MSADQTAIIIQARFGSSRLPGKAVLDLCGKPVLGHVIERCQRAKLAQRIVCATTLEAESPQILSICHQYGIDAVQGSLNDVLDRYRQAAEHVQARHVVRVTSDCPLIDPEVIDELIGLYRSADVAYANNIEPRTYPHGLDCEIFSKALLDQAAAQAKDPREREHVTPWMREQPSIKRTYLSQDQENLSAMRWTLDYPADHTFFGALLSANPALVDKGYREIAAFVATRPDIARLNAQHRV